MSSNVTNTTQEKVYLAVRAFHSVHGRVPAVQHLVEMLHSSNYVIRRFDRSLVQTVPVQHEYVKLAKSITVLTAEQINAKKAAAGKSPRRSHNRTRLENAIERVVRKAKEQESSGVDVIHDHRRPFPRVALKAVRVG